MNICKKFIITRHCKKTFKKMTTHVRECMRQPSRVRTCECKCLDEKLNAKLTLRFYARLKIFEDGFGCGFVTKRTFQFRRHNIFYENDGKNIGVRVQMYYRDKFVKYLLEYDKNTWNQGVSPRFICEADRDNVPAGFECWRICSKFIVYTPSPATVRYTDDLTCRKFVPSTYISDQISVSISTDEFTERICIFLPGLVSKECIALLFRAKREK
jgi:hypothetical protein